MNPYITFFIGIAVGAIISWRIAYHILRVKIKKLTPKHAGYLNTYPDTDGGNRPHFFLDLDESPDVISKQDYVVFKVSQK